MSTETQSVVKKYTVGDYIFVVEIKPTLEEENYHPSFPGEEKAACDMAKVKQRWNAQSIIKHSFMFCDIMNISELSDGHKLGKDFFNFFFSILYFSFIFWL